LYVGGCDPKKFPPFKDAEMQARIEKIGNSLVPAYQRALPDSDPAKIDFRYQLIDTKLFREALTLPDGIILVPHQVVERLQNDAQLAAVVAEAMACALERQEYRAEDKQKTAVAVTLAGAFVPYAGPSIAGTGESYRLKILMTEMEQRGRVSLTLLHDAGYDIDQAPIAWWLLAPGKQQPLSEIEMPDRAGYLYRILGEAWHNPVAKQQSH
jgi:predicted Zn-dependent protease